ncbi:multiple C2 and transmembrane domain-containing protein 2-like, partial [Trifolium medium]|nr:multiple C2 and transmembrane domain-containing protein 2-like [Trifolium medium]
LLVLLPNMADEKVDFSLKAISPNIRATKIPGNGGITSQTDLIEMNLFLFVKIVRARNLFAHYGHYNFDPYVEVKAGSFQGRTLCFRRNSNPEWNQVFALDNDHIQTEEITTVEILLKDNVLNLHHNGVYSRINEGDDLGASL